MTEDALQAMLDDFVGRHGQLVVLTGAGISAESGIPTFRGPQGYWKVGSKNYHPQELATASAFGQLPREVWRWYLYRRTVCLGAGPNPGHDALARIERGLGDRFTLVTQNVDGLHRRAGSSDPFEIHGNIDRFRCSVRCTDATYALPDDLPAQTRDAPLDDETYARLRCPDCGALARPHVLWFDECYDEALFRASSAYARAAAGDLLIVVGTSGSTSLPIQIGMHCAQRGIPMIDINPEDNPFGELARSTGAGLELRTAAASALTTIASIVAPPR
ncbi:MAG: Sir2 family NAD-dependent protein deacetylase [Myxococcota bacterium]